MNNKLHHAAQAVKWLTGKGFDKEVSLTMVTEDYGVTREQIAPLLVDAKGLPPDEYSVAKNNLLKAVK